MKRKACKKKKKKKKNRASLEKKLWSIFSRFIRIRDAVKTTGGSEYLNCITCGKSVQIAGSDCNAGHFQTRAHKATKFDEQNVHGQCVSCNKYHSGEQFIHGQKIVLMYGQEALDRILSLKYESRQYKVYELEELVTEYRLKIREYTDKYGNPWKTEL